VASWGRDALLGDVVSRRGVRALRAPAPGESVDGANAARRHSPYLRGQSARHAGLTAQSRAPHWHDSASGEGERIRRSSGSKPLNDDSARRPRGRSGRLRVLIVDDHRLFAEAVKAVLAGNERIEVVGYAADGEQAVTLAAELSPDLVLMDLHMPRMDGLEATRRIREKAAIRILLLTSSQEPSDVARARRAGASGFLRKEMRPDDLLDRVLDVGRAVA
jgi:CheY-like chemotaxis protein